MKAMVFAAALLAAGSAFAQGRAPLGEMWVYPSMFDQTLRPLAPIAARMARENSCPNLSMGEDRVLYTYSVDVKMKARGSADSKSWEVIDLKLVNPSGCEKLDAEFSRYMKTSIPQFGEPRKDLDGDGWIRVPKIQLRVVD